MSIWRPFCTIALADVPADAAIRNAYCLGLYDKALDILEDVEGRRGDFPSVCCEASDQTLAHPQEQLRLHRAVLELSKLAPADQERGYRLVTPNDDRFEKAGLPRLWIEAAPRLARPR